VLLAGLLRSRAVVAAFALLGAGAGCIVGALWLGNEERPPAKLGDAKTVLVAFEKERSADQEIDLAALYGGRLELLDPRRTLPTWHKHLPSDAVATRAALRDCGQQSVFVADPELAKAIDWHAASCAHSGALLETLAARPPFMHPTGSSYAQLLRSESPRPDRSWLGAHKRAFHVLELRDLPPELLTPDERTLSELPAAAFARIIEGDATVLTNAWIMHVSRDQYGPTKLALRTRDRWNAFAERSGVSLGRASGACVEPASPVLCWRAERVPASRRTSVRALGGGGAVLLCAGLALSIALVVRARREAERERVFLLRTLTHELRSPVTAMRLDVEPLRAAFDALPEDCQEPMLRLSAGIERLSRVLEVTGRALSLFDSRGENGSIDARLIPSLNAYFEELRGEWPEDVTLDLPEEDGAFSTDPDWLRVAVKNLVANAAKHGEAPVRVTARMSDRGDELIVRVSDQGKTPDLRLANVTRPFVKGPGSGGLGLGLSLVSRIVERQGGRLRHEPDPTTFELRMPRGTNR
jgi:signal transduction histidine kinase